MRRGVAFVIVFLAGALLLSLCDRVLFLSHGKILLAGDPRTLPGEHGRATLEDLFITVAREPLALEQA